MESREIWNNGGRLPLEIIARRLKAMAEPSRLSLLHLLCESEMSVTRLVQRTGMSQASVSKHLRVLREEGLVDSRRERRMIYYRLKSSMPKEICDQVCRSIEEDVEREKKNVGEYWRRSNE